MPSCLYMQFFTRNPNLQSPDLNFEQKTRKIKKPKKLTSISISARAHSQLAIYTVFHAESESAVRNLRKLQENQNVEKTKISKQKSANPLFVLFSLFFLFGGPSEPPLRNT